MLPGAIETNLTPSALDGATVTGNATPHTKGGWTELIASTGAEAQAICVNIGNISTAATDTSVLLDLGTGPASSETVLISNILAGQAQSNSGKTYIFPVQIASGTRISARLQGTQASETAVVSVFLYQSIQQIQDVSGWTAYGPDTADSLGADVTPGSAAWGSWTEIGTTSAAHNVFAVSMDLAGDTNVTSGASHLVQIGYGATAPGAGGTAIDATLSFWVLGGEDVGGPQPTAAVYADVASGTKVWARMANNNGEARAVAIYGAAGTLVTGGIPAVRDFILALT